MLVCIQWWVFASKEGKKETLLIAYLHSEIIYWVVGFHLLISRLLQSCPLAQGSSWFIFEKGNKTELSTFPHIEDVASFTEFVYVPEREREFFSFFFFNPILFGGYWYLLRDW